MIAIKGGTLLTVPDAIVGTKHINLLEPTPFLFVVVRKDEWEAHKQDNENRGPLFMTIAHDSDADLDRVTIDEKAYPFDYREFEQNPSLPNPIKGESELLWACHGVATELISPEILAARDELIALLEKWNKEKDNLTD